MATILCLETASTNCSVAISVDGKIIAKKEDRTPGYSHAEKLHVFIDAVLKEAKIKLSDLDAVAVSKGPGSYTGLRIGVSAAKGLCFSLNIPLISVATLQSLSLQAGASFQFIIPMLDARRMEVYSAIFNSEGEEIRETRAEILTSDSFIEYLEKGKVCFLGDGSPKFQAICEHENASFLTEKQPSANEMSKLAECKYKISDTEDVAYFEPFYLKDFVAGK